ncbi:hypothetical protein PDT38_11925 [Bacillus sp. CLL-3-40]|nr:hypothetical protein [Bacillus changyiensis]
MIGVIAYYYTNMNSVEKGYEIENKKNFLNDKVAAVYYSGSAYTPQEGSYTVYIDKKGVASAVRGDAIEVGTIAQGKNFVVRQNEKEVLMIGGNLKKFPIKHKVHTSYGQSSGYLNKTNLFYFINNQGFGEKQYNSLIRWGNQNNFREKIIPGYYVSTGNDEENIYVITEDMDTGKVNFQSINVSEKKVFLNKRIPITGLKDGNWSIASQILINKGLAYFIVDNQSDESKKIQLKIAIVDIKNQKFKGTYPLGTYNIPIEISNLASQFTTNNFIIKDHKLYHLAANSYLYTFDLKKMQVAESYPLTRSTKFEDQADMTYFGDSEIFLLEKRESGNFEINSYSYENGKKIKTIPIKGLEKIVNKHNVFQYDFFMINRNRE